MYVLVGVDLCLLVVYGLLLVCAGVHVLYLCFGCVWVCIGVCWFLVVFIGCVWVVCWLYLFVFAGVGFGVCIGVYAFYRRV